MANKVVEIARLETRQLELILIGDSPLISHAWSEKAKKTMRDKQMKKATGGREAKDPEQEFQNSLHHMPGGGHGFPAIGFKASGVTAVTSLASMTKVAARQAFHINGDLIRIEGAPPRMREDMVRVGMGLADLRYRGEFWPWFVRLPVSYNTKMFSIEQIVNLFNTAGFAVGVGEWRPERDGQFGRFHVADESEAKALAKKAPKLRAAE